MVGRDVAMRISRPPCATSGVALAVKGLSSPGSTGKNVVDRVDLELRCGEILGVAGVDGNGQTELAEALFGLRPVSSGSVTFFGRDVTYSEVRRRRPSGISYVPSDRRGVGSIGSKSISENVILGAMDDFSHHGILDRRKARHAAGRLIERFDIKTPSPEFPAGNLSGGNLQKLALGREVSQHPKVLLVEQPTRGLDVSAIETVWLELLAQRSSGTAILLISAELEEILNLSDRIAVMFEGRIMGVVDAEDAEAELLGAMMAGAQGRRHG